MPMFGAEFHNDHLSSMIPTNMLSCILNLPCIQYNAVISVYCTVNGARIALEKFTVYLFSVTMVQERELQLLAAATNRLVQQYELQTVKNE